MALTMTEREETAHDERCLDGCKGTVARQDMRWRVGEVTRKEFRFRCLCCGRKWLGWRVVDMSASQ